MRTLIKNGLVITSTDTVQADLAFENGLVTQIGENLNVQPGDKVVNAEGQFILPGGVDVHVHLDLPMFGTVSSDDHYTGTKAAAFGGTTTVIDFISQDSDNLLENVEKLKEKAESKAAVDFGFHMNITHLTNEVEEQIPTLVDAGISSIKVFTAYNKRLRLQDEEIFRVMRTAGEHGILTMLHAENGDLIEILVREALQAGNTAPIFHARTRPAWGATEAVCRGASLASVANAPLYIVHINTRGEVDQLEYARNNGVRIYGETCPQYLIFTDDQLSREDGAKWICSPPLRKDEDRERIWEGLKSGIVKTVATDHCPFFNDGTKAITYEGELVAIPGKELGKGNFTKIPNGLPGIGDRLPVMWTEMVVKRNFSANRFVELNCTNPARLFGMYPQKGSLLQGSDADIVIWNPNKELEYGVKYSQQRTDHNLYEGWRLTGFPEQVFSRGELIVDQGEWKGKAGRGKYIKRKPFKDMD